jgi:hypothetical protein
LASLYDELPWTSFVTLTAPPGALGDYLEAWGEPDRQWFGESTRLEWQPFWIMVVSNHADPHLHPRDGHVHVHLLVGNVPHDDVVSSLSTWPGIKYAEPVPSRQTPSRNRWRILHYMFSQERAVRRPDGTWDISGKLRHARDVLSRCHPLLAVRMSDNLHILEREILQARRDEASRRARAAARARWEKEKPWHRRTQRLTGRKGPGPPIQSRSNVEGDFGPLPRARPTSEEAATASDHRARGAKGLHAPARALRLPPSPGFPERCLRDHGKPRFRVETGRPR